MDWCCARFQSPKDHIQRINRERQQELLRELAQCAEQLAEAPNTLLSARQATLLHELHELQKI